MVSTLPEQVRAWAEQEGRALQIPSGHRMEAGDMLSPLGTYPGLGQWFSLSCWFSEQDHGKEGIKSGQRRERQRIKNRGSKNIPGGSLASLLRGAGGGERQNKRHKKKNEPKQHKHEGCEVQSKQCRGRPLPKIPSAFGGSGGPAENAALLWPGEEGRARDAALLRENISRSVFARRTPTVSIDKLSKDD